MKKLLIVFSFGLAVSAGAAKISEYGTTNVVLDTDKLLIAHGTSTNYGVTFSDFKGNVTSNINTMAVGTMTVTNISSTGVGNTNASAVWGPNGNLTNGIVPARSVGITIDGGGSAITSGTKGYVSVPFAGTITKAIAMADVSGSIECRFWRTNSADGSFPPTAAGAIGTNSLSTDIYNVDSTLTGWTTAISAGDVIGFNIPGNATSITRCTIQLTIQP